MLYRKEKFLKIPVNSLSIKEFCYREDDFSTEIITDELFNFIVPKLDKFQLTPFDLQFTLKEIVQNIYDAYAKNGLKLDQSLIIKTVVQMKNDSLWVKIKDNGSGFTTMQTNRFFQRKDIVYENKDREQFCGGFKAGLEYIEMEIQQAQGELFLKNRKDDGAAYYIKFTPPVKEKTNDLERCSAHLTAKL